MTMYEDDEEDYEKQPAVRMPAAERIERVEENFYSQLSCALFKYVPARPGLKTWAFFAVYAVLWVVLAVVYIYTSVSYKNVWVIILGLAFLVGMALGAVFLIRGVVFYYYDMYVCRVGDNVVGILFSHWNKDVTVYFSHGRILRARKGAVEERGEYAYQYVGTHLLFNKFKADAKYVPGAFETITAVSNDGGTARMRVENDLPAGITYAPPPSLRSEFGAIKYLKLLKMQAEEIPPLPAYLVRECALRGWQLPEGVSTDEEAEQKEKRKRERAREKEREKEERKRQRKVEREEERGDGGYEDDDDDD